MPPITRDDQRRALLAGIARAHQLGVTSVQNASGNAEEFALYEELRRSGELKLRVYSALSVAPGFTATDADRFDAIRASVAGDRFFKAGAAKLLIDGVIETNTAMMLAPYDNNPKSTGLPNYPPEEFDRIVGLLDARGYQIFVHAIGDGGVRRTLDAFEKAAKANPAPARGRRHRIEHIETMDPADVPRFKALSVIGSFQPPHARLMNNPEPRGQWAGNIGAGRTSHGWMWKSVKDAGGRLSFGSDWPVASLNPLVGIWVGVNRIGHGAVPTQRLTIGEMIDGYTADAAYASFDEADKGRVAEGQLADLVVLSRDVLTRPPAAADDVQVQTTIFGGAVVYRRDAEPRRLANAVARRAELQLRLEAALKSGPTHRVRRWLSQGDARHREPLLAIEVVDDLPLVVDHHRRTAAGVVRRPMRDSGVVRTAGARKRHPGRAHLVGERLDLGTGADHLRRVPHVVEHEGQLHAVRGQKQAVPHRRPPVDLPEEGRRPALSRLELRLPDREHRHGANREVQLGRCGVRAPPPEDLQDPAGVAAEHVRGSEPGPHRGVVHFDQVGGVVGPLGFGRADQHRDVGGQIGRARLERQVRKRPPVDDRTEGDPRADAGLQQPARRHPVELVDLRRFEAEIGQDRLGSCLRHCLRDGGILRAALQAGAVEETLGRRHGHERRDLAGAARLAEEHHLARVAAEAGDVVAHPLEGRDQIELSRVARSGVAPTADLIEVQITEDVEPMVDRHHRDVAGAGEIRAVGEERRARAVVEQPAVDVDEHGPRSARASRGVDVQHQAVFAERRVGAHPRADDGGRHRQLHRAVAVLVGIADAGPGRRPLRRKEAVGAGGRRAVRNPAKDMDAVVDDATHLPRRRLDNRARWRPVRLRRRRARTHQPGPAGQRRREHRPAADQSGHSELEAEAQLHRARPHHRQRLLPRRGRRHLRAVVAQRQHRVGVEDVEHVEREAQPRCRRSGSPCRRGSGSRSRPAARRSRGCWPGW